MSMKKFETVAAPKAEPAARRPNHLPAALILIVGAAAALAFRQEAERPAAATSTTQDVLVRRVHSPDEATDRSTTQLLGYVEPSVRLGDAQPQRRTASQVDQASAWADVGSRQTAVVATPIVPQNAPPPAMGSFAAARIAAVGPPPMATMRPYEAKAAERSAGASVLSSTPANAPRNHTVRDGDTLGDLAERYYGDARRYREIYDANRAALQSPEVLPIGASLVIPAYDPRVAAPPRNDPPAARLVPQVILQQP